MGCIFRVLVTVALYACLLTCIEAQRASAPTKTRDLQDSGIKLETVSVTGTGEVVEDKDSEDSEDSDSTEEAREYFNDEQRAVEMANSYDRMISIYWSGTADQEVKMGDIEAGSKMVLNTYNNHRFFASEFDNPRSPLSNVITISGKESLYTVRSEDYKSKGTPIGAGGPKSTGSSKRKERVKRSSPDAIHPSIKFLHTPTTSMNAKFRCFVPDTVSIWYEDGRGGTYQGQLGLGKEYTINTYEAHVFFFTNEDKTVEYARHSMHKDIVTYGVSDPLRPGPAALLLKHHRELQFSEEYYNRTGIRWRHFFGDDGPRGPPSLFMWPSSPVGTKHYIESTEGQWHCTGPKSECQTQGHSLTMEVVSNEPRVFVIDDFLSDFEADQIIELARPREHGSQVGNVDAGGARKSDTRTSKNAWIPRDTSYITETISKRAADVLQLDESMLNRHHAEDLQVVHYDIGQKYDSHHDWGVSGYAASRFITILFYLTDMEHPNAGGETAFPKAAGGGIKAHPGKGGAVMFYNLLEDGNGDDLALHAALPVKTGEKWLANYWVWDPHRK